MIPEQLFILDCIKQYYTKNNCLPTGNTPTNALGVNISSVRRHFGSWSNALICAGFVPRKLPSVDTKCSTCSKQITVQHTHFHKQPNHFCSHSCSATYTNAQRAPRTQKSKQQVSETMKQVHSTGIYKNNPNWKSKQTTHGNHVICEHPCIVCAALFTAKKSKQTCSPACKSVLSSQNTSKWLRANRSHIRGRSVPSYMEQSFKDWLIHNGIKQSVHGFLTEVHFYNKTTKKNGWADFVFPRLKIIIELDGSQHQKRKHLDSIRDEHLVSRGWEVIRITHKEYKNKIKYNFICMKLQISVGPSGLEPELQV